MIHCRFHDSEVLVSEVTSGQSELLLDNLQEAQTGDYRCRANNDVSAIYSDPAALQVKGMDDTDIHGIFPL